MFCRELLFLALQPKTKQMLIKKMVTLYNPQVEKYI